MQREKKKELRKMIVEEEMEIARMIKEKQKDLTRIRTVKDEEDIKSCYISQRRICAEKGEDISII